jgi:hypothetical protein
MKTLFTLSFALLCLTSTAQSTKVKLPITDGLLSYEKVITLDSSYKAQMLYKSAKTWFVNTFHNAKAVIQSEDQMNGRFLAKCIMPINASIWCNGSITPEIGMYIQIDVKDGKYRYRLYNFNYFVTDIANGNQTAHHLEQGYALYLEDKTPKGITMSRKSLNEKLDTAYLSLLQNTDQLIASLNNAMKTSKSDDF